MEVAKLRAQLETEIEWREQELTHLRNLLIANETDNTALQAGRRAVVVMEYAHIEGFAKVAFETYIQFINESRMCYSQVHRSVAVAGLGPLLDEHDAGRASYDTSGELPRDKPLRTVCRREKLFDRLRELDQDICQLDGSYVANFEMNFGQSVLRRTARMLAIDDKDFGSGLRTLEYVRKHRNDVAHGARTSIEGGREFDRHIEKCSEFRTTLARVLTEAARSRSFAKESELPVT